jgi:2-methylcitrate dehydratase PrpD
MTGAGRLADFAHELRFERLPDDVVERAKLHALDALGCGLAASERGLGGEARAWVVDEWAPLGRAAQLLGRGGPAAPSEAALANGMLCHALDYDDTHPEALVHPSTVVVPAALAVAQTHGATGQQLLTAIVAGVETATRLGLVAPAAFHERGLHPTSVCGVFGATMAVCSLLGLPADTTTAALGLAGSTSSGLFEYLAEGTATKPFHAGWAAHAGVVCAALATRGAAGPATVLEGRFGIYRALLGADCGEALAEQLADLGSRWETLAVAIKPYPACHFIHAALDAVRELRDQGLEADGVAALAVGLPADALPIVAEPAERKLAPATAYEAKFSVQFSVAAMLAGGVVDLGTYEGASLADPRVGELAGLVEVSAAAREDRGPLFGIVTAQLEDGSTRLADVAHPTGTPERPLKLDGVLAKFHANADGTLGRERAAALADTMLSLERLPSLETLPLTARDPDSA